MKVELLDREMVDSDLGVVNAARCSFDKESQWDDTSSVNQESALILKQSDVKLITYLAKHNHWTPFAHAQEMFDLHLSENETLHFLLKCNLSGFEWLDVSQAIEVIETTQSGSERSVSHWYIRGSLYAWLTNLQHLPRDVATDIGCTLSQRYPISYAALKPHCSLSQYPQQGHCRVKNTWVVDSDLVPITLRIHCPIFVKRQLETHRRNLVMTDIEDFSQNEVSRRYITSDPEFYVPKAWHPQSKDKKQGIEQHLGLSQRDTLLNTHDYNYCMQVAHTYYIAMNNRGTAHEESRMHLPLSTYTTFWWTGSLKSWRRVIALRSQPDVQGVTRELAAMIAGAIEQVVAI